jgi:hypothetical protein
MHSPEVLAWSVYRPWPTIRKQSHRANAPKWQLPIRKRKGGGFYMSHFGYFNGYELYWPSAIDVWHMEPGGADALTICRDRKKDKHGNWKFTHGWKWHFWHYKVSWSFIYGWRRYLLTRCAECGGPSRKGHMVNVSNGGWDGGPKVPIWCGEVHLFHSECLSRVNKQYHTHDPRGCYACSGKASFEYNRNKVLPAIRPEMPLEQRKVLDGLHAGVNLGMLDRSRAIEQYQAKKLRASKWL